MTKVLARLRPVGRQSSVLFAALLACAAISTASAAGPVSQANAGSIFCNGWLKPWGQAGDRCDAENKGSGQLSKVAVGASERAGCVTYVGWYGEYHHAWACTPAGTQKDLFVPLDGGWHRGAIRNNNKSSGAYFTGWQHCYGETEFDFCY
jgi:hypothetical protein